MPLRTFGKFNDQTTVLWVLRVPGRGAAVIFTPSCDQGDPHRRRTNSKDGHARKHYPVKFYGPARRHAPCTFCGLWGSAAQVLATVKRTLQAPAQT